MSTVENVQFPVKVLLNKEKTKVLLAEVDSDLADILLSFLTLPLGIIVRLFQKHYGQSSPVVGSLNTLYKGLENLDEGCFGVKQGKQVLLNPKSCFSDDYCRKLKLNLDDCLPTKCLDGCGRQSWSSGNCGYCGSALGVLRNTDAVFTVQTTRFVISDDMQMVPLSGSILQNLLKLGITDIDGVEERTVQFGLNEIMGLLKGVMMSRTPLTDLILKNGQTNPFVEKCGTISSHQIDKKEASSCPSKMFVEVVLQKSTNKLLFAHANEEFVAFLFSLFAIPLGGVAHVLHCCTGLGSVDKFYGSVTSFNCTTELKTEGIKARLLKPTLLPCMYFSKCQLLPVERDVYNGFGFDYDPKTLDPRSSAGYVRKPQMFMVANDLSVTPLSALSTISQLNMLKIPLSDVEEVKVEIGVEEALEILKASLTSTAALTSVVEPAFQRQVKKLKTSP